MSLHHTATVRTFLALAVAALALVSGCGGKAATSPSASPTFSGDAKGRVLVVVADEDFNDSELWTVHDALVSAGYRPVVADPGGTQAEGMDGTTVDPDLSLGDADPAEYVAVAVIGGSGAIQLFDDRQLHDIVRRSADEKKVVGAICLAPVALARAGVLTGKRATVWPDNKEDLSAAGCSAVDDAVVVDGLIVTGNGPDAAQEFAQAFVSTLSANARGPTTPQ